MQPRHTHSLIYMMKVTLNTTRWEKDGRIFCFLATNIMKEDKVEEDGPGYYKFSTITQTGLSAPGKNILKPNCRLRQGNSFAIQKSLKKFLKEKRSTNNSVGRMDFTLCDQKIKSDL